MNTNAKLFWILFGFFVAADITYVIWGIIVHNDGYVTQLAGSAGGGVTSPVDWVGAVGIGLAAILSAFIAFYLQRSHRALGGELPEDRLDADIDDGDPEQGFFSPWSWWPVLLAAGAAMLFMGIAIGFWIACIGVAVTAISLVGLVYEYYRGNFAR